MPDDNEAVLTGLNDRLADILTEAGTAARRQLHSIAIEDTDLQVAATAIWKDPNRRPDGEQRLCGVQMGFHSPTLFDGEAHEFSYANGPSDEDALIAALESWAAYDLPVLTEAAFGKTTRCTAMEMRREGIAPGAWRITAGPLVYLAGQAGAQPCCNGCLLAVSMPSLIPLMTRPDSFAIKLVAIKHEDGTTSADCRRNGEDLPEVIAAVSQAAADWPSLEGTQMRKQYLYFQAPPRLDA